MPIQLMEQAVDEKIEEQAQFVEWWKESVTPRQSPGGSHPASNADRRSMVSKDDAEDKTGIKQQQFSRWNSRLKNPSRYRALLITAAYKSAQMVVADNHRAQGTGDNEWYTPLEYIERARDVLGGIDVDPASSEAAQDGIRAKVFFTRANDGRTALRKPGLLREAPSSIANSRRRREQ